MNRKLGNKNSHKNILIGGQIRLYNKILHQILTKIERELKK